MIFLALPALQLSQRDTQRKSDITRLKEAYQHYKANNKSGIHFTDNYVKISMILWINICAQTEKALKI